MVRTNKPTLTPIILTVWVAGRSVCNTSLFYISMAKIINFFKKYPIECMGVGSFGPIIVSSGLGNDSGIIGSLLLAKHAIEEAE